MTSVETLARAGVDKQTCEGALRSIGRKLYGRQYALGRQSNTLNE